MSEKADSVMTDAVDRLEHLTDVEKDTIRWSVDDDTSNGGRIAAIRTLAVALNEARKAARAWKRAAKGNRALRLDREDDLEYEYVRAEDAEAERDALRDKLERMTAERDALQDKLDRACRLLSVCEFDDQVDLDDLDIIHEDTGTGPALGATGPWNGANTETLMYHPPEHRCPVCKSLLVEVRPGDWRCMVCGEKEEEQ